MLEPQKKEEEKMIRINGMDQVLSLLQTADPAFRQSLIKRISAREPELARVLVRELALRT